MFTNLLSLMQNRIDALYIQDDMKRLISVNEPDTNQITPRLAIMRSEERVLWRIRHDESDDIVEILNSLIKSEPPTSDFKKPLKYQAEYSQILGQNTPINTIHSGPAYVFPELSPSEKTILIGEDNTNLVAQHFPYTLEIIGFRSPVIVGVVDDSAVSACFSARKTNTVAEAGVFTIEAYRKKGYAYTVVRDWAIAIRERGLQPIYSTSYDNLASQSVANKLGAIQFATDFSFT